MDKKIGLIKFSDENKDYGLLVIDSKIIEKTSK